MSNSTTDVGYDLEQELDALFIPTAYYLDVVSIALTIYEHLITLNTERRVIWGRKRSIPTMLFLSNRYLLWLYCLSSVLWDLVQWKSDKVSSPDDSCYLAGTLNILVTIVLVLVIAVFLAVRVHAINGHRWFWTCLVFALSSAAAPYDFAALILARFQQFNGSGLPLARGCFIQSTDVFSHPSWNQGAFYPLRRSRAVAVQACGCVSNAIVVFITWYRTKDIIFVGRRSGMRTTLASSLLQSGIVFFLVDLLLNIAQIYLFVSLGGSIATFSVTVESILTSRFILSLRMHDGTEDALQMYTLSNATSSRSSDAQAQTSVLVFEHMAAPLDLWDEDEEEDPG